MSEHDARPDLGALRARLAAMPAGELWRSFDELAGTAEFGEFLAHEFPHHAAGILGALDRREFLRLMAGSLALAGLGACTRQPEERVVPYVRQPEGTVLGEPLFFATAMPLAGYGIGVLVESHENRPTKIEGNPGHPASLGASDAVVQAAALTLYDPDRAQVITSAGHIRPWAAFRDALAAALDAVRARRGAGLRVLTGAVTSPTLAHQMSALQEAFPEARWHRWEPTAHDPARAGSLRAFGEMLETRYRFDQADLVLALDADFLGQGPARLRHARDRTARRRQDRAANRLYVVESTPSVTGAVADHRLPARAGDVEGIARTLAGRLGVALRAPGAPGSTPPAWIEAVVADLARHRGTSVVIAGDEQPAAVHALAHAMNQTLGNVGRTVDYTAPVEAAPVDHLASLRELVGDMDRGAVDVLLILGANPVYTAPPDLEFAARLAKVPLRVHLSLHEDETSVLCHWHIPETHFLESWSDVRAYDGTATVIQPLIAPLYGGRSPHELLGACIGTDHSAHDEVRAYWSSQHGAADFEAFWRKTLHDGVVPDTRLAAHSPALRPDWDAAPSAPASQDLELVFRPDPYLLDGRFANNGWLLELSRPITKLVWDNAALVAPATAERLRIATDDVVELRLGERTLRAPVWVQPGQAIDSVTLHLGFGRTRAGRIGTGVGANAYALRAADAPHVASGLEIRPTGERHRLVSTQGHHAMEGRPLVRVGTVEEYRAHPDFAREMVEEPPEDLSLYPRVFYGGHAWGMAIDLDTCIGCNACVLACQAENNIPVVGKTEVARGRDMHWIRVDRYYAGALDDPQILHQPVPCMHCETAPCEVVCPVNATVHSSEGLNLQVYNRCVGTRYCSNNCPYKVRRFNFFLYQDWTTETLKMLRNPEVTVRSRGVMEKCTYCVQRIERTRIRAEREGRPIHDGEIVTACQQACPADAIVFGDLNDRDSRVARLKAEPRNYALLGELNTRPRTTYLAALRNPSPGLGTRSAG